VDVKQRGLGYCFTKGVVVGAQIPGVIGDVDEMWLKSELGWDVDSIEVQQIGAGIGVSSALYRCTLSGPNCPSSVVVKLPALDEAAVFTSTMLRMYIREANFFGSLCNEMPVDVPLAYLARVDEATSQFVVVMEDLGGLRVVDQNDGMAITDAYAAIDAAAKLHAKWWGRGDELSAAGTTISLGDPIYPAVLPFVFGEGWEKLTKEMELPASIMEIGPRFSERLPSLLQSLVTGPNTLCHGDYRADNILFNQAGEPVLVDFQLLGSGTGAYDVAYFVTQSLSMQDASRHERELFDRWITGLTGAGLIVNTDDLWLQYRRCALFCLAYPVIASRGMDLNNPRERKLIEMMNERFDRAVRELNLAELM
jgi:thiamine kinase-like enzyme